jgi:hypothetical protein
MPLQGWPCAALLQGWMLLVLAAAEGRWMLPLMELLVLPAAQGA